MPLASSRGRSEGGWLFLAVILSPIIAAIWLLCLENLTATRRHQELLQAVSRAGGPRQPVRAPRGSRPSPGPIAPTRGPRIP